MSKEKEKKKKVTWPALIIAYVVLTLIVGLGWHAANRTAKGSTRKGKAFAGPNIFVEGNIVTMTNEAGELTEVLIGPRRRMAIADTYDTNNVVSWNSHQFLMEFVIIEENTFAYFAPNAGSREYLIQPSNQKEGRTVLQVSGSGVHSFNMRLAPPSTYAVAHVDYTIGTILDPGPDGK
jgi:hypothetical protein